MAGQFWQGVCFRDLPDAGWVSVYYPIAADYSTALSLLDGINTLEMALVPGNVLSTFIRVSDLEVKGDSAFQTPTQGNGTYTTGTPGTVDPATALQIRMIGGPLRRASRYLRGLPDTLYNAVDRASFTPDGTWATNYGAWKTGLMANFQLVRKKLPGPTFTATPITGASDFLNGSTYLTTIRRAGRPFGLRRGRRLSA